MLNTIAGCNEGGQSTPPAGVVNIVTRAQGSAIERHGVGLRTMIVCPVPCSNSAASPPWAGPDHDDGQVRGILTQGERPQDAVCDDDNESRPGERAVNWHCRTPSSSGSPLPKPQHGQQMASTPAKGQPQGGGGSLGT